MEVINNQTKYGVLLQTDFGKVHAQENDYNSEILYSVKRLPNDLNDKDVPISTNPAGAGNNASIDFAPNYTAVTGAKSPGVHREAIYGRPYRPFAPTAWLLNTAFADKYNDSRFDNSFRTVWYTSASDGAAINYPDTGFVLATSQHAADSMNALHKPWPIVATSQFWTPQNNNVRDIFPYNMKFADSTKGNYNDVVDGRPECPAIY